MLRLRQYRLGRVLSGGLILMATASLLALEPPTEKELKRAGGKKDWAKRVAQAKALGNHKADPALVANMRARLQRQVAQAAGLPAQSVLNAPPPARQGGLPASGSPKVLVVLVDFPDYPHAATDTVEDVQSKFFGDGDASQAPYESLRNFYQRSSYNALNVQGTVLGWKRASHNRSWYQSHTSGFPLYISDGEPTLVEEVLNYYNSSIDYTQFDNDGNGYLDSIYIKWTGPDNGWSNFWWAKQKSWPHGLFVPHDSYKVDGKKLNKYVWSWIWNQNYDGQTIYQAHIDIHETGHLLGLPDLYDYDDTVGPDGGVGGLDMMDGNWGDHNCFSKFMLGWLTPKYIVSGSQMLALAPTGTTKDCVLVMPSSTYSPGAIFDEFFMAQYRKQGDGNDPWNYPSNGYTLWHIDSTLSGDNFAYDNSTTSHKLVRLMEADGQEDIENNRGLNDGDPYRSGNALAHATAPNSRDYGNNSTGVSIDQFTTANGTMGARFSVNNGAAAIVSAGYGLGAQSCSPDNAAIDPGESVTVSLWLQNIGTANTANLTATLQATGGITSPSGAQNYGALAPNGATVGRNFSFVANGDCGGMAYATIALQDGATGYTAVTYPMRLGKAALDQNFDSAYLPAMPSGWTTAQAGGATPWSTTSASVDTAPFAAFSPDVSWVADNSMISPSFLVTSAYTQLTFRQSYDLNAYYDESGNVTAAWDGGVLEIAIGGGAFTDIIDAGGSFVTGGYNNWIQSGYQNPIGNRWGWGGRSNGYVTCVVNLPASANGQNVQLRWRMGTDDGEDAPGWYVDSISTRIAVPAAEFFDLVTAPALPTDWSTGGSVSFVTTTAQKDSGANSLYSSSPDYIAENWAESAAVTVSVTKPQLIFRQWFGFEEGYDGGMLEISINGGAYADIIAAGGSFVTGGYNITIPSGWGNPLAGRAAWSGDSSGFISTVINLPAAAVNQSIRLRWRQGTDNAYGWGGWYIDNITIAGGCCG